MTDFESEDNSLYALPEWWDNEYHKCKKEDAYEWFTGAYDDNLMQLIYSLIPSKESSIINLGCGISKIQEVIYDKGFHNITNIDISPKCIELCKESDTRGMKWDVVDVTKPFPYPEGSFDFAIDKGTLDALIIERSDKWEIGEDVYEDAAKYFRQVYKVLKPGGTFIQITFGQPHFRKRLFEQSEFNWTVKVHTLPPTRSFHFFVYECKKNE
ncbi:S-adenosyl-L-methionine-dependent methyltransferase [Histomonas meleagridis]|uniref:S-adenosyl-L-methionine-dependent methyltransferase n=1 Tax=Histomonas meleagridis TaxID=135588 RepID=UPI003559B481|nr:S-adenosyl-L-methionine-dependent methyltransferase [Histomonas meleagridis]KAH0800389.1 S-adenosyl-L-methionine-dependent methyltransferase [Histomonas meleagridis]